MLLLTFLYRILIHCCLPIKGSNRLSNNSSNKQVFDMSKGEYEKALRESGYKNVSLIYT